MANNNINNKYNIHFIKKGKKGLWSLRHHTLSFCHRTTLLLSIDRLAKTSGIPLTQIICSRKHLRPEVKEVDGVTFSIPNNMLTRADAVQYAILIYLKRNV